MTRVKRIEIMTEQPEFEYRFRGKISDFNSSENKQCGLILHDLGNGTSVEIFFHADEFKTNTRNLISAGREVEYSVRLKKIPDGENAEKSIKNMKAIDCILVFSNNMYMSREEISQYIRDSAENSENRG